MSDAKRPIKILLIENNPESGRTRAEQIRLFEHPKRQYDVVLARDETEARDLIDGQAFEFMLVDLLLKEGSSAENISEIGDEHVDDPENGAWVTRRLLDHHREVHHEKPQDPRQLRPIIYSAARLEEHEADRIRVKILCLGAYDFMSRAPREMEDVLLSLGDMCDLQEEMNRVKEGKGWVSTVINNLGVGISIIGKSSCKIWYCSPKNAVYSGLDPNRFHDGVCWHEYYDLRGLHVPDPESPAFMVMDSTLCPYPRKRDHRCITRRYPFKKLDRSCSHPSGIGEACPTAGELLNSYTNCRLLPIRREDLKWVHVIAAPIWSEDGKRVIGAVETVIDFHDSYQAYWDRQLLAGEVSAEEMLEPALHIAQWLGYARAQLFRLSGGRKELVPMTHVDSREPLVDFKARRFPVTSSLVTAALNSPGPHEAIHAGPGLAGEEVNRTEGQQYLELVLRDAGTDDVLGTLVVDNVGEAGDENRHAFTKEDLARLRPVARYAAHILTLQSRFDQQSALQRREHDLRDLDLRADIEQTDTAEKPLREQAEALRCFLTEQLAHLLEKEPDVVGFHFRFRQPDGSLRLYRESDPYTQYAKQKDIAPGDRDSLSALCFREKRMQLKVEAQEEPGLLSFRRAIRESSLSPAEKQKALAWCDSIRALGCFPIYFGSRGIGVLAVQSRAADLFASRSADYMSDICNLVARILGPVAQEEDHYDFRENAAYAFYGPASTIRDIAETRWAHEDDPAKRAPVEGEYALAWLLVTKATNFLMARRGAPPRLPQSKAVDAQSLWRRWCAIFRGMSEYSRKSIDLVLHEAGPNPILTGVELRTDEMLLTEVVYNIFENAWKACSGTVRVEVSLAEDGLVIDIKDDGQGINDAYIEESSDSGGLMTRRGASRIWEGGHSDFEIDTTQGAGLGLKFSKRHADLLGVALHAFAHGGINGGAHFRIVIPVQRTNS
jgi:hypothetical protein